MSQQDTRKRQGKQSRCAAEEPTSLLSQDDDLLGLIHIHLDSPESKRSFRHAHSTLYKSRAINAQIWSCAVDAEATPARALACFPRYATLKAVCFRGTASPDSRLNESILSKAVRLKTERLLASVETIKLQAWCDLDESTAALMLVLFPKLSSGPKTTLELGCSSATTAFFQVLASHAKGLEKLRVAHCPCFVQSLPLLSSVEWPLRCLEVEEHGDAEEWDLSLLGVVRMGCLSSLQNTLHELTLCNLDIDELGDLLQELPHLHMLVLRYTSILPGTPVASKSLKRLVLDASLPPHLCRSSFPSLQLLEVHSMHFNDLLAEDEADVYELDDVGVYDALAAVIVQRLGNLASVLSELPVKMGNCGSFHFVLFSSAFLLSDKMLDALAPLHPYFCRDVRAVAVEGMLVDAKGLATLSDLCKNMASFTIEKSQHSSDAAYIGDHGLLQTVASLRQLEHMRLRIDFPPHDLLAALLAVGQASRPFTLSLEPTTAECRAQLTEYAVQWIVAQPLLPTVTVHVEEGT